MSQSLNNLISQDNVKTVLNIISNHHNGFQICHLNARSLSSTKIDYLNYILPQKGVDVLAISETWFKKEVDDRFYELKNYKLFRHDRQSSTRGGGIALYIRKYLNIKILLKSTFDEAVEYIGVEISGHDDTKCLLICVYNPNRSNDLSSFFSKLAQISLQYEKTIVCGDFNINLLNVDSKAKMFLDSIASCGLLAVNHLPTRYGLNCTPALLDLVLCSNNSLSFTLTNSHLEDYLITTCWCMFVILIRIRNRKKI